MPANPIHPTDADQLDQLDHSVDVSARRLALTALAVRGLTSSLDAHGDVERRALVLKAAEQLSNARLLLDAARGLLDAAATVTAAPPPPAPVVPIPPIPVPGPQRAPVDVRRRPVQAAEARTLPTEGDRTGGPYVARHSAAEGDDALSVTAGSNAESPTRELYSIADLDRALGEVG